MNSFSSSTRVSGHPDAHLCPPRHDHEKNPAADLQLALAVFQTRCYNACIRETGGSTMKEFRLGRCLICLLLILILIAASAAAALNRLAVEASLGRIVEADDLSSLKRADCVLVLGCGVTSAGTPTPMLADRLETGVAVFRTGCADVLLMTGDGRSLAYDEVTPMRKAAEEAGVDPELIVGDTLGLSTSQSLLRARDEFGFRKVVIVTQRYHLPRALYLARALGLDAVGVPAADIRYTGQIFRDIREVIARCKDVLFCITGMFP